MCVSGCGCVKCDCLVWPAPAPARSEAPVTCKVAKGEWRTCEQKKKKQKKGAGSPRVLRVSPQLVDWVSVVSVWFVCFFLGGGVTCSGDATSGRRVPTENEPWNPGRLHSQQHLQKKKNEKSLECFFLAVKQEKKHGGLGQQMGRPAGPHPMHSTFPMGGRSARSHFSNVADGHAIAFMCLKNMHMQN